MHVFLTGGSGFVGGHLIRRLVSDGHMVAALARSEPAEDRVGSLGARSVRGDLSDRAALAAGMEEAEVVFHCAALVGSHLDPQRAEEINVVGTGNVVTEASRSDVRRLVHLSTESVLLDGRALEGVDESEPVPTRGHLSAYASTKAVAERIVLEANGSDLETIAVRPRMVWGPEDRTWLPGLIEKVDAGTFRWVDGGRHPVSSCHVFNLVEGLVLAAERGRPGSPYFVTDGSPRTFREFAEAYLATAGVDPGDASVPGWLMRAVGATLETVWRVLPTDSAPPVNRVEANMVSHPQVVDDSLARAELGYEPVIEFEQGMAALRG